jgi:hypothetical protein
MTWTEGGGRPGTYRSRRVAGPPQSRQTAWTAASMAARPGGVSGARRTGPVTRIPAPGVAPCPQHELETLNRGKIRAAGPPSYASLGRARPGTSQCVSGHVTAPAACTSNGLNGTLNYRIGGPVGFDSRRQPALPDPTRRRGTPNDASCRTKNWFWTSLPGCLAESDCFNLSHAGCDGLHTRFFLRNAQIVPSSFRSRLTK